MLDTKKSAGTRTALFSTTAVFFAVLVFFAIFEGGLRLVFHRSMDFDLEMWKYARELKKVSENPDIGHEHRPGRSAHLMGADMTINQHGLRDEAMSLEKPADEHRVMMLGDSLTVGWGVEVEKTTSRILENKLNESFRNNTIQVVNAGVGNYNTSMEVEWFFSKGIQFSPDVVVLNYFINDTEKTPKRKEFSVFEWSYAFVFLRARLDTFARQSFNRADWKSYYKSLYTDTNPGKKKAAEAIRRLAQYCKETGTPLIVAHYPELHVLENYPFKGVRQWVRELAAENGAEFVDLLPAVAGLEPQSLWVSRTDAHPNGRANSRFAARLFKPVRNALRTTEPPT